MCGLRFYIKILAFLSSIFFIGSMLFVQKAHAQKVGVVMSGGGASGIAHIGVLKALEENHIPVNCISGRRIF